MKIFLNIVILLLCVEVFFVDANACLCMPTSAKEKLKSAKVVFYGEAISTTCSTGCPENIITFKVEKYWKGVVNSQMKITTKLPIGAACGVDVKKGDRILVLAQENEKKKLEITICSSLDLKDARKDLKALGNPKVFSK